MTLDVRWLKNRHKVLNEVYVAPIYHRMGETQSALPGLAARPMRSNNKISQTEYIGLGELEGPEDVILDRDDHLYCGTRHGEIIRFFAPDYRRSEVFAHIGGFPLGLAFDRDRNAALLRRRHGALFDLEDRRGEASSRPRPTAPGRSIVDDARLRDPNDLDVAPDGTHLLHRFHHALRRA